MAKISIPKRTRKKMHELIESKIRESAESIAEACNAESSWGFYKAYHSDGASRVVALNSKDNARSNRLLRNADRGRAR